MGNCIGTAFTLSGNDKKLSPDKEDNQELKASAMVAGKISSGPVSELCNGPLPLAALLKSGQVYRVIPQLKQQDSLQVSDSCDAQSVKLVVTKKQLQRLMRSMEELKLSRIAIQSTRKRGKKWRPSLATIPEL